LALAGEKIVVNFDGVPYVTEGVKVVNLVTPYMS
jgi:hypothetical protein